MSEDTLRQDISRILEDVRGYTVSVSNEWIGHIIERVRAEDAVKSTGASLPWHVAIHNTGNAVAGKKISKQLRALVKTSSRYGHVYEKTGPLTYTCTGCGGRIYPFTGTVPGVRDHRTGVDGCIKIVSVAQAGTEDAGACSGDRMHCPAIGCVWPDCGRDDSDFVDTPPVEAGESAGEITDDEEATENTAVEAKRTESAGGNEAQAHSPLARPSSPPPRKQYDQPLLEQIKRCAEANPTCHCSLCDAARLLGQTP